MRKRLWGCGVGGMIVICVVVVLWFISIDRLKLLERSTRITSVRGWGMERPDIDTPPGIYLFMEAGAQYQWVSNKQVLFFHDLKPIQTKGGAIFWPNSVGTPTLYDVATLREIPLPRLAQFFRHTQGSVGGATVSPDGSRLLWRDNDVHFYSALLDGSHRIQRRNDEVFSMGWSPDCKEFCTCTWSEDNKKKDVIALHCWDSETGATVDSRQLVIPEANKLKGDYALLPDGSLAIHNMPSNLTAPTLYHISSPLNSVVRRVTPELPAGMRVDALVSSPRGDRLAWIITRSYSSPLSFLHRVLPRINPPPIRTAALWVSGTMGENLHEIGHIPVRPDGRQFYLINYVRWQPDGKTLSFVSNDTLYTVPAN